MATQGDRSEHDDHDHGATGAFDPDAIMGVRVVRDDDPPAAAARLAAELDGEVVADLEHAEAAFAARADAGRTEAVVLSAAERAELVERAGGLDVMANVTAVDDDKIAELRELAVALGLTDRIRSMTEVDFTESLTRRLSASSGVAVHPEAIRQAAEALTSAEAEVADVDASLGALGERPKPEPLAPTPEPDLVERPRAMFDEDELENQRRARVSALSLFVAFTGGALILLALGVSVVLPAVVFLLGMIVASAIMIRFRGRDDEDDQGHREASSALASAAAQADRGVASAHRTRVAEEEWLARRAQLEPQRERAQEKVRSARRHWESLAGPDADPYDVDGVLRIHDPQFVLTGAATKTSPTVRTVHAVHRKAIARWRVAWASLGYDEPPSPEQLDDALAGLAGGATNDPNGSDAARAAARLRAADAWIEAGATIDRALIVVDPGTWLPSETLGSMLAALPAGADVIIVQR
jgi:membrane protein implicated in regulation of membrane protease activity